MLILFRIYIFMSSYYVVFGKVKSILNFFFPKRKLFLKHFHFSMKFVFLLVDDDDSEKKNEINNEMSGKVRDIHEKIKIYVYLLCSMWKK